MLALITGFVAILLSIYPLRLLLFFVSTGYLLYIASKIAFVCTKLAFVEVQEAPGILIGILLQVINPKAFVVNTSSIMGFGFFQAAPQSKSF